MSASVDTFLISLKGVFNTLNEVEGKVDQELGLKLRDIIRDFLALPSQSEAAEDKAKEGLWNELGKFFNGETTPLLAKLPPLVDPASRGPKYRLYDLILEQRRAGVTPATPASGPATPPPASAPAPAPASAPATGNTPTVTDPYLDPNIQTRLQTLLFGNVGALAEITTLLGQPPYNFSTPAMVTERLEQRFNRGEGWAKKVMDDQKNASKTQEREAKRAKQEQANEAAAKARLDARIIGGPTTATPPTPQAGRLFRLGRSSPWSRGLHLPPRWKWGLSGFILGGLLVLAAFIFFIRQTNHVTETTNGVVTKDETVDEMYSMPVILLASAGVGIVIGFGLVGIYSSLGGRKESGA